MKYIKIISSAEIRNFNEVQILDVYILANRKKEYYSHHLTIKYELS